MYRKAILKTFLQNRRNYILPEKRPAKLMKTYYFPGSSGHGWVSACTPVLPALMDSLHKTAATSGWEEILQAGKEVTPWKEEGRPGLFRQAWLRRMLGCN